MDKLQVLAEQYANREDLYTEDGEYTNTTIINAFNEGAMTALQTLLLGVVAHSQQQVKEQDKGAWISYRNPPTHECKVLLMNCRGGFEYSTGYYDVEDEQWYADDKTFLGVDYWKEI